MDNLQRRFINRFQGGFPVVGQPFSSVAAALGTDEATLISVVNSLLEDGTLSRFGPLYDASRLGGELTLAAMRVPDDRYKAIADEVNALHAIAHNYRRDHELNMWFVIASESKGGVQQVIAEIEKAHELPVYNFPKLREFYLGLWIEIDNQGHVSTRPVDIVDQHGDVKLTELDYSIIRATQEGLPVTDKPYEQVAELIHSDAKTVMQHLNKMLQAQVIRRIGAVPNHYKLGLKGNGMSVWDVPDDRIEVLGRQVGQLDFVSHCYERPRHLPTWPYNLFAMVHGHNREEVTSKVEEIAVMLGTECRRHEILFSSAILKKTGLRMAA